MSQPLRKLHWDFFGPHARGTAEHYLRHLHEFVARRELAACQSGIESMAPNHCGVWCVAADVAGEQLLISALRPRRATAL